MKYLLLLLLLLLRIFLSLCPQRAQLAIGAISITPSRRKAVDFTQPYMRSGLQIAMKIPPAPQPNYFRFLQPFTWKLWCVIFVAMVTMGVVNWLFSILSPNGFYGKCAQASTRAKVGETKLICSYIQIFVQVFTFINSQLLIFEK